jgi:hypothetical protein
MATPRGKETPDDENVTDPEDVEQGAGARGAVPDLMRRALAAGFSGFFLTESAFRKALGDALPRDWADFASEQSNRARDEFFERLGQEAGRALENMDLAEVLTQLLEGRTVEITAQIRLGPKDDETGRRGLRFDVEGEGGRE